MSRAYWAQFSSVEIDSMHGIEPEDYDHDTDSDHDEDDTDSDQECSCCCSRNPCGNCMDCLGMSWSDFM